MEFKELIHARRSVRGYESAVDHGDLISILREAQQAPSWTNQQTSRCYAVESPEMLEKLRGALPAFNRNSSANAALVVTTYVKNVVGFGPDGPVNEIGNGWGAYDLGLHDAYLILAAKDHGYDTLIMGIRDASLIRETLGIPEDEEILSVIAVGKRSAEPSERPRKELGEVVRFF
ncbi:MAG: nitroreductase family protein [Clostridia bacterium]|nr:nitroreductase family protein [Clostridia bacterium]